ncbi:Serine/threonine-protein phosphatase 7 long form homolog [Linum grandiflorum]
MELCTALMERWRPETTTFHMYHGEMTITLEDVSFITGLPVDGAAVFEEYLTRDYDWDETIFRILGETSGADDYAKDGRLKLAWLKHTFMDPSRIPSSDELQWKQYARAYALACFRPFLMADRSGAAVHPVQMMTSSTHDSRESWGDVGGWMVLLQAWALERFPSIAQRTHDDRHRGPDGQDHPCLRRCSLEPNRTLF